MIKKINLLDYIIKEYIDRAIEELGENNNYNLSKGSEISFIVFSSHLRKQTFKKMLPPWKKYYKIMINPSMKELHLTNIFMTIFQRHSDMKMRDMEYITNNMFSRFRDKAKTEFI